MSEAETPQQPSPESHAIPEILMPTEAESEWETVDFPNALSVDAIPEADDPQVDVHADYAAQLVGLESENNRLLDRIAKLEAALEESKMRFLTEAERIEARAGAQYAKAQERSHQQEGIIKRQQQDLTFAATRIRDQELKLAMQSEELTETQLKANHLAQELDLVYQSSQKQQILVETLTQQLQSSQEQVAQLERDCALVQQKFTEQVGLVRQGEQTCKDLRSRLQRQQRYTLQFKVALEKCLDVHSSSTPLPEPIEETLPQSFYGDRAANFIKAQPVQPWSSSLFPNFDASDFADLIESDPVEPAEERPELSLEAADFWATDSDLVEDLAADQSAASLLEELQAAQQAELRSPEETAQFTEETLAVPSPAPVSGMQQFAAFGHAPVEATNPFKLDEADDFTVDAIVATPVTVEVETSAITVFQPSDRAEENAAPIPSPAELAQPKPSSPFITLKPMQPVADRQPTVTPAAPADDSEKGSDLSPVVYPQRSTKKISSLAAVDLPSFPRHNG